MLTQMTNQQQDESKDSSRRICAETTPNKNIDLRVNNSNNPTTNNNPFQSKLHTDTDFPLPSEFPD